MLWGGGITNNKQPEQEIIKNENVNLAIYLENEQTTSIPSKDSGYYFDREKSSCTNDAYINWDSVSWSPVIKNAHNYPVRCELHFTTTYNEGILNGTDPILKDELIPVEIEDDGTVKRADLGSKWYSYEEKTWANAVILKDESTNNNYAVGATIPEEAIESYFVWIPRYRYQIFDDGNYTSLTTVNNSVQTIQIQFENKDTAVSSGTTTGSWLTHPAFTAFDSNGMWVGKFEPSRNGGSGDNIRNGDVLEIKPNVSSWRSIQVANAFYSSYDYKRNLESHMMKNT